MRRAHHRQVTDGATALRPGLRRLAAALDPGLGRGPRELTRHGGPRPAAVLLMLTDDDQPDITFTERAHTLRHHPGQISLPGGAVEVGESPVDAALREAEEEIGLPPASVRVLGSLPEAHVTVSRFQVTAVVGLWDGTAPIAAVGLDEVAGVHRIPVGVLVDPATRATAVLPGGYRGPAFVLGDLFIWGFTAHLVDHVLRVAGWEQPWGGARELPVPRRFHRDRAID